MNRRRSLLYSITSVPDNYLKINAYAQSCENMFTDVPVPKEFTIDTTSLLGFCSFSKLFYTTSSYIQTPVTLNIIGGTSKIKDFSLWLCRRPGIETINGELDFSGCTSLDRPFLYCSALKNISVKPGSIHTDFDISSTSVLTSESIESIINGLASGESHTVKLNTNQKITQIQSDAVSAKGWTLSGGAVQ